ncbi:MAG: hypothetical protein VX367_10290 [SAR324 cluster bacterium]|nr:hypothetical protein [SAR324 cluster bacterium]
MFVRGKGVGVRLGLGCPCPPVRNDIVTPASLVLSSYQRQIIKENIARTLQPTFTFMQQLDSFLRKLVLVHFDAESDQFQQQLGTMALSI